MKSTMEFLKPKVVLENADDDSYVNADEVSSSLDRSLAPPSVDSCDKAKEMH